MADAVPHDAGQAHPLRGPGRGRHAGAHLPYHIYHVRLARNCAIPTDANMLCEASHPSCMEKGSPKLQGEQEACNLIVILPRALPAQRTCQNRGARHISTSECRPKKGPLKERGVQWAGGCEVRQGRGCHGIRAHRGRLAHGQPGGCCAA